MAKITSEADLCSKFLDAVDDKWTAYPETCGWDILLVRKSDGFQIGIQAKLRLNAEVIAQCLEYSAIHVDQPGPDCRAVLVPPLGGAKGFREICAYAGITVIRMRDDDPLVHRFRHMKAQFFSPELPDDPDGRGFDNEYWYELCPVKREKLPAYIPDAKAGTKSPIRLTEWKVKAIKLLILLERNGSVTRDDFKHLRLDHRLWISVGRGWLDAKDGKFFKLPGTPDLKAQHPRNWDEILADIDKWAPPKLANSVARLI